MVLSEGQKVVMLETDCPCGVCERYIGKVATVKTPNISNSGKIEVRSGTNQSIIATKVRPLEMENI